MNIVRKLLRILMRAVPAIFALLICVTSIRSLISVNVFNETAVPVEATINAVSGKYAAISWDYNGKTEYGVLSIDANSLQAGDLAAIWISPSEPDLYSVRSSQSISAYIACIALSVVMLLCEGYFLKKDL